MKGRFDSFITITKHNYIVKDVTRLADTVRKDFAIAMEGRRYSC